MDQAAPTRLSLGTCPWARRGPRQRPPRLVPIVEMFVGVSRVRGLFEQGNKDAPCIIFLDAAERRERSAGSRAASVLKSR